MYSTEIKPDSAYSYMSHWWSQANKDPEDEIWHEHHDIWFLIRDVTHFQHDRLPVSISAAVALAVPLMRLTDLMALKPLFTLRASWLDLIWLLEALIMRQGRFMMARNVGDGGCKKPLNKYHI